MTDLVRIDVPALLAEAWCVPCGDAVVPFALVWDRVLTDDEVDALALDVADQLDHPPADA